MRLFLIGGNPEIGLEQEDDNQNRDDEEYLADGHGFISPLCRRTSNKAVPALFNLIIEIVFDSQICVKSNVKKGYSLFPFS